MCTGHDYSGPGKPSIDWDEPGAKDTLVSALVNDANALVEAFAGVDLDEQSAGGVGVAALVAGQDVEPAEGSDGTDGRWRIARKVAPDRVISTVDTPRRGTPQVTRGAPGRVPGPRCRRTGDGASSPTRRSPRAAGPRTPIRVWRRSSWPPNDEVATVEAHHPTEDGEDEDGVDGAGVMGPVWMGPAHGVVYGDSAYGTGDLRGAIDDAGHEAVIKPKPLQAPVEGGFTVDDFHRRRGSGHGGLPGRSHPPDQPNPGGQLRCTVRGCPLRERCTTSKTGRKIVLHQRDDLLRRARRDWAAQPNLREKYRTFRPNVERVISQIASRGGRRIKLRYRGTEKNNAWLTRRTAGLNLRNLVGRGLTRTAGVWVLAAQTA
ncbi:hypothetical protein FXW78_45865 [Rhodococcus opacus]|nr:hypothetical protein [Rhodococcus opacus]